MTRHPLARFVIAGAATVAALACSQHTATTAQEEGDRGQGAQHASEAAPEAPAIAQTPVQVGVRPEERREPRPRVVSIAAGTRIEVRLAAAVSSATATPGQRVEGALAAPLAAGGAIVAPAGTPIEATVEAAVPSGRLARPARLALDVTGLRVGDAWLPIVTSSLVRTGPAHTKRNSRLIAGGAALGAIVGQLLGGNHNPTLRGAAVGAAGGTGAAAATGKLDVAIGPGEILAFTLAQPLDLRG